MKSLSVRIACLLLVILSTFYIFTPKAQATAYTDGLPSLDGAKSVYFANLDNGKLLAKKDDGARIAPASTVKIMTGLIAIEHFAGSYDTVITITDAMLQASEGTSMHLTTGDRLQVIELIYGVICGGANDAAYALAFAISGNEQQFTALMNAKAKELGLSNTHYSNPTGWDSEGMYTTLDDTILLAKSAAKNDLYLEISSAVSKEISFENQKNSVLVNNRNALISSFYAQGYTSRYARGLIAGMTDLGGYCVITAPKINGSEYLCIVMGAQEYDGNLMSFDIAYNLMSYAQKNLGLVPLMKKDTEICDIPVDFALEGSSDKEYRLKLYTAEDAMAFIPLYADLEAEITYRYYLYSERLTAPVSEDTRVGGVDFYYNGELVATVPLVAGKDVAPNSFAISMQKAKNFLLSRSFILSIVSFAIIFSLWFYFFDYKPRRRSKKVNYRRF